MVVSRKYPSASFATDLASRLVALRIDTVILAGGEYERCIRASAVDSVSPGFATIVVREAVAGRSHSPT
jgi:maleamate amidohydrolase